MKYNFTLLLLLLGLSACNNGAPKSADIPAAPSASMAPATGPALYLNAIYATAGAEVSDVRNLFDGNPATIWTGRKGAGPDEGIMLYFQSRPSIRSITVNPEAGSFAAPQSDMAQIQVFGNGAVLGMGAAGQPIALGIAPLESMYIRILSTGKEKEIDLQGVKASVYPENDHIGIAEIVLKNDKDETLHVVPPVFLPATISASSTLAPESAYSVSNLFDGRKEFCWVEGDASGSGEGASVRCSFNDSGAEITALQLWNGYQRSDEHYSANARAREIEIAGLQGGSMLYTLKDDKAGQRITLKEPLKGGCVITVKSVYPGSKYKDMAISDIVFYRGEQPVLPQSALPQTYRDALTARLGGSPLGRWLDRRVFNILFPNESTALLQSLILRSDGTFVVYTRKYDPDETLPGDEQETIADGNWQLVSADAKGAVVKIFGKWVDYSSIDDYYKGAGAQELTRIFNEQLTLRGNKLKGTRMLGEFTL